MNEPGYKPDQWILYSSEAASGFGQIVGGTHDGSEWTYSVKGPILDTTLEAVPESSITHFYENGSWLEARHGSSAAASAYTQ